MGCWAAPVGGSGVGIDAVRVLRRRGRTALRDGDHGGPQQPIVHDVTRLPDLAHGSRRSFGGFPLVHPLVIFGVELLAPRVEPADAWFLEGGQQPAPDPLPANPTLLSSLPPLRRPPPNP